MATETTPSDTIAHTQTTDIDNVHRLSREGWELVNVVVSHYSSNYGNLHATEFIYFMKWRKP